MDAVDFISLAGNHTAGTQAVAKLRVETAHEIRTVLLECAQSPTREQVRTGITAYLRQVSRTPQPR